LILREIDKFKNKHKFNDIESHIQRLSEDRYVDNSYGNSFEFTRKPKYKNLNLNNENGEGSNLLDINNHN
jgi:hypothetical protein